MSNMQESTASSSDGSEVLDLEGIVKEIDEIFLQQVVRFVDFMPTFTPPYVLFAENTLGISMKVLKPLYKQVYQQFTQVYHEWKSIEGTTDNVLHKTLLHISRIVLLIKGDLNFVYNARKAVLLQLPGMISAEIQFLAIVFSKHPKSPSGWDHRRWCLKQHMDRVHRNRLIESEIETERELCRDMAEKFPKNYYAWMHRLWLLSFMNLHQLEDEIRFSKSWLIAHVSDHSAVNHLLHVLQTILSQPQTLHDIIPNLLQESDRPTPICNHVNWESLSDSLKLIQIILDICTELILTRPGRESLWCLRRSLLQLTTTFTSPSTPSSSSSSIEDDQRNQDTTNLLLIVPMAITHTSQETTDTVTYCSNVFQTTHDFMLEEIKFIIFTMKHQSIWDDALQRKHAMRYLLFVINQMPCLPKELLDEDHYTIWKNEIQRFLSEQEVHIPTPVLERLQLTVNVNRSIESNVDIVS